MPSTCGEAPEPEAGLDTQSGGYGGAQIGEATRQTPGVQEWPDGSRYEGEFVSGFKHGHGRYTWSNGEYYEGSFYKDYRHGPGEYCWPSGHKFTGKFYLNRKEGYGQQRFPDGATFKGLYHTDQRFGPGVVTYPDGCEDVGLWLGERLLKLCTAVEGGFSLENIPQYSAYKDPAATADPLPVTQPDVRADSETEPDKDLLSDDDVILPPGMELYSTNGEHLPLPPGRRRELDRHFYGELWEPDSHPHRGYERDPISTLPLQARMQAHIHKHRLQAESVCWDVAAVLSLNRQGFGPKGALESSSELLIQQAAEGELQDVSQILQTGLVHPDVSDSQGHTALIAATVNCRNSVIQMLLDMGADIDKLNCEGMSALAVCHVLYYPFQSLHNPLAEPPAKTKGVWRPPSAKKKSLQISQAECTTDTPRTLEELTESDLLNNSKESNDNELLSEPGQSEAESSVNSECPPEKEEEEGKEKEKEGDGEEAESEGPPRDTEERSEKEDETESKADESETGSRCDQPGENEESVAKEEENKPENSEKKEEEDMVGEGTQTEFREERTEVTEEEDAEKKLSDTDEEDGKEEEEKATERTIQVLDGHIALGSVQWKDCRAKASGGTQGKDKDSTQKVAFDSACSVSSYGIQVTEEVMHRSAEALSRTGVPQSSSSQETVRKMAAMKLKHRVRLTTMKLLLERGADPNASRIPMPVLFIAIMAADTEAVRRLLISGARTDIPLPPERKGLYPLHVAAALPGPAGPKITELLLHTLSDPNVQACDQHDIFHQDKAQEPLSPHQNLNLSEGGRTALHVACQRESDYRNASKVVALLLAHRADTSLLWSGHSPLSMAIATGNDLAVEELLKGGANPNMPLGSRVGSALCALANINYHLGGNRTKLLDILAKANADILMPIMLGDDVGTAVDYAYNSFNQDIRIANIPFHALNYRERETFKARRQLLTMMGELLREAATGHEENLDGLRKAAFRFCYYCGRSVSMKLTACSRCHKVFFCSRACKMKAWDERHKDECIRAGTASAADVIRKSVALKSQSGPRPLSVVLKPKPVRRLSRFSVPLKFQRVPLRKPEKIPESNLKENYSLI